MKTSIIRQFLIPLLLCAGAGAQLDDQPVEKGAREQERGHNRIPTFWIIGDSTVKVGTKDQRGWGEEIAPFFDPTKMQVVNRAIGGRSTRTFLSDGRWDAILKEMRAGDVVIMQFGHNDAGPINEEPPVTSATRSRGVIRNNSDESVDIVNVLNGKPETVHSYGWYLRHFVKTAKEKGAQVVVCSPIPRKSWNKEERINRSADSWTLWARQAAEQSGAYFIDLNEIIARAYEKIGKDAVEPLFADKGTHTSKEGAAFNARAVISGLNGLGASNPVASGLTDEGRKTPAFRK
jgi:lysophospholipase L1-like esterase